MIVVLVVVGVVALAAAVVAPFLLPWERHLRWLIAANVTPDPWSRGRLSNLLLDEVRVHSQIGDEVLVDTASGTREALIASGVATFDRGWLDRWAAARTLLLRVVRPAGAVSLHGPTHAVTGLGSRAVVAPTGGDIAVVERRLEPPTRTSA
jgi:hypothetical protein